MVVGYGIRRRRPGIREQSRSGRTETRIRRGDGQRAEPVGFRRGIWHESFGNGAFDIYEELQAGGCVYLDQVHTADCWRFGEPGSGYAGRKPRSFRHIDIYWIHNPADVEKWTPYLIPLVKSGKVKRIGVSNHNLAQIKRAEEILSKEGVHIFAVQNHYSLLYRSSRKPVFWTIARRTVSTSGLTWYWSKER